MHCTGRVYDYLLPTYALMEMKAFQQVLPIEVAPVAPRATAELLEVAEKKRKRADDDGADVDEDAETTGEPETHSAVQPADQPTDSVDGKAATSDAVAKGDALVYDHDERMYLFPDIAADLVASLRKYRISSEIMTHVRRLFQMYCGTVAFHNFTPRGDAHDPSTIRFMREITVSDPIMLRDAASGEETEFVRVRLDGQSFMLNQIRKMIGTICLMITLGLEDDWLKELLDRRTRRFVPIAPANGLFLVDLEFQRYNSSLTRIQVGGNACGKCTVEPSKVDEQAVKSMDAQILASILSRETKERIGARFTRGYRHYAAVLWDKVIP